MLVAQVARVYAALVAAAAAVALLVALVAAGPVRDELRFGFGGIPHSPGEAWEIFVNNGRVAVAVVAASAAVNGLWLRKDVRYAGLQDARATASVVAGQTTVVDIALKAPLYAGSDEASAVEDIVVTAARGGQAKALMERRVAMNAKNVVPADNFGALTMGDVGEFMKSMPGLSIDYTEVDATAVRIGGLPPKYSTFTMDGARMATATSNNNSGRQNSFEQMSITGIDSIELNNTLTARITNRRRLTIAARPRSIAVPRSM